jgi:O-antigen ligase
MLSWLENKLPIVACIFVGLMAGLVALALSPVIGKNILFVALVPLAGLFVLVMFLDVRWMMIFLLYTRALLDPILDMTRFGEGAGMGAVLNLLIVVVAFTLMVRFPKQITGHRAFIKSWIIFLSACFLCVVFSVERVKSFKLWLNFVTYFCIVLIPLMTVKKPADKRFWLKALFFSSFLPICFAYAGVVTKHPVFYAFGRLKGTFTHSNILAFYIVLIIGVDFYILKTSLFRLTLAQKCWLWIYMVMLLVLLIITQTRSAWISCVALFLIYSLLKEKKLLFVLILVIPLLLMVPQVKTRLSELTEGTGTRKSEQMNSMTWRLKLWESSLNSIRQRPLFGYGLGSFEKMSRSFAKMDKWGSAAHNSYLELMFETGIVGLLSYLWIYWVVLKTFFLKMKSKIRGVSLEAAVVFSCTIAYFLVGFSDNTLYYLALNWYFWFFIGLVLQSFSFADETA